ncbi:MAG: hypothetical protein AB7K09_23445 [Planctomycetota bacterium]
MLFPIAADGSPIDPAHTDKWVRVRDGLGMLRGAHLGALIYLLLIGVGAAVLVFGMGMRPGSGGELPGTPGVMMVVPIVLAVPLIILGLVQMVGYVKCLSAPAGWPRTWIISSTVVSTLGMLASVALVVITTLAPAGPGGMAPGLPQTMIALQIAGNVASLLASVMFLLFLRAIGQHFGNDSLVGTVNQLMFLGGVVTLAAVGVGVWSVMSGGAGFDPDAFRRGTPGMIEVVIVAALGLTMLFSIIWYLRALGGARDTIDQALKPAAARFVERMRTLTV